VSAVPTNAGVLLAAALALAWAVDVLFGEPRNAWHPVAWLGRLLGPLGQRLSGWPARWAFGGGLLAWLAGAGLLAAAATLAQAALLNLAAAWAVLPLALLLKPCFAWRMLHDEVRAVEQALGRGLPEGRARVARLVSRDVALMDAAEVRETAIETLAENLNDSVVAPLFWFAVAGLPGALVYRFANTADAMWGYRGRYEWAGKWAARADDVLSWLPARLSALLLCPFGPGPGRGIAGRWAGLRREARHTPSPNGGWPMAAMALRLGVCLRKPGVYALNAQAPSPGPADLARALQHAAVAAWAAAALALAGSAWLAGGLSGLRGP
jgi:adenosylcobinamide-phosphate synthase